MGFYIQTSVNKGKADLLVKEGATLLKAPIRTFAEVPAGKFMVAVVDNGPFEAAGICYDEVEHKHWIDQYYDESGAHPRDIEVHKTADEEQYQKLFAMYDKVMKIMTPGARPYKWLLVDGSVANKFLPEKLHR